MYLKTFFFGRSDKFNFLPDAEYDFEETRFVKELNLSNEKYYIWFSSLARAVYFVDKELHQIISKKDFSSLNLALKKSFAEIGLVLPKDKSHLIPKTPKRKHWYDATQINVFLTTKCNLRCVYCYASGGERQSTIDFDFVKYVIDEIIKRHGKISVSFHGGGETTVEFELMKKIVEYVKSKTKQYSFSVQSNMMFSDQIAEFMHENRFHISPSWDGPPFIQDKQRPRPFGKPSSMYIEKLFKKWGKKLRLHSIRATITRFSQNYIEDMIYYFPRFGVTYLHLEPMFTTGRASKLPGLEMTEEPDWDVYIREILRATDLGRYFGLRIKSTYLPYDMFHISFCGASNPMVSLATDGYLTACHESPTNQNGIPEFIWGKFDKEKREIIEFEDRKRFLQNRLVVNMPDCQDCFLKWQCSGDCLIKVHKLSGNMYKPVKERCDIKRELSGKYLEQIFESEILKRTPYLELINNKLILRFTHHEIEIKMFNSPEELISEKIKQGLIIITKYNISQWLEFVKKYLPKDKLIRALFIYFENYIPFAEVDTNNNDFLPVIDLSNISNNNSAQYNAQHNSKIPNDSEINENKYYSMLEELFSVLDSEGVLYKIISELPHCRFSEAFIKSHEKKLALREFSRIKVKDQWYDIYNNIILDSSNATTILDNLAKIEKSKCKFCIKDIKDKCDFKALDIINFIKRVLKNNNFSLSNEKQINVHEEKIA